MEKLSVLNIKGEKVKDITLNETVWGIVPNDAVLYDAITLTRNSLRQGTADTKTRSEVSGGGRKPWRQKGTGHARQGSTRSPQWKGGGVVFAPTPRDYSFKLNKKEKRAALKSALTSRVNESKLIVVDDLKLDEVKTKKMAGALKALNAEKALIVLNEDNDNVALSARNIPTVKVSYINTINVYDILKYNTLVLSKDAVAAIEEVYA